MSGIETLGKYDYYVISEIGINHNGSRDEAKRLIDASAAAGAHAVKFQKRDLQSIYTPGLLADPNSAEWSFQYLLPQLMELELEEDTYHELKAHTQAAGLDFIITPFDESSADFVAGLGVEAVKFSSADLINWPLIRHTLDQLSCTALFSTGMWKEDVIRRSAEFISSNFDNKFALLLCQSTYPAPLYALNLRFIETLKQLAPMVGYSGHERGVDAAVLAYALGASVIEKHITRDNTQLGPDHKASLEPDEFAEMVRRLEEARSMLGEDQKVVTQAEILNKEVFAKSVVVKKDMGVGETLEISDLQVRSPGKGILPDRLHEIVGKTLMRPKQANDYLTDEDFEKQIEIAEWKKFDFSKRWGVKCRFHDFETYKVLKTPCIEFHCSEKDVEPGPKYHSDASNLVIHAPEIIGNELFDLCSDDPDLVSKSMETLQKTLDRTRELATGFRADELPKIVLHVGGMSSRDEGQNCASLTRRAEKALRDFDLDGLELLPENLPPRPWYLGGQWYQFGFMRPEDMASFCKSLSLGMTFDVCHAQLYCKYAGITLTDYAKIILPHIRHVHLSDAHGIDGEGVQVDEGEIDFDALFRQIEKIPFSWVPEIWSGHTNNGAGTHTALCRLEKYGHAGAL